MGRYRCTFQLLGKRRSFQQKVTFGNALRNNNNNNDKKQIPMNIMGAWRFLNRMRIKC
jgi:hypothetical protein